ncbi:Isochorismatase hydrolase [Mycena indigotica]|uniref:Isochorismatase hydrolase n=1 Tax=Mycena indigotica TaxID=2126181 RepID=A0A8H6W6R4_9AGAR|nr:Isochorismatase hydrolase [Mycena indigotica]KAF7306902.1 Isochorismatase hydrolase [Mycena indigotica]
MPPTHDTPILGMVARPHVEQPTEYGCEATPQGWWTEWPSGLVDVSRTSHIVESDSASPPPLTSELVDIPCDGERVVRVKRAATAMVVIDMQNFFLHPELRDHPKGLACVDPLLKCLPALRAAGIKVLWVNWGLTDAELLTIPPSLVRGFQKNGRGGFGSELPAGFGRLLMRDAKNSMLHGPLQDDFEANRSKDVWIHKNRMSGLWGYQSALDLYLQENGITTLLFSGVNADQCVGGTLVDAYYRGYDCILVKDATATTSPEGGYENVVYNAGNSYGFVVDSARLAALT